jgi:PAS domain S-box-containing protein
MTQSPVQDKRFRQVLDAAPDAMVVVDQVGIVVALNREAERLFGWTDAELRGEPSGRLIPQRFQQVFCSRRFPMPWQADDREA